MVRRFIRDGFLRAPAGGDQFSRLATFVLHGRPGLPADLPGPHFFLFPAHARIGRGVRRQRWRRSMSAHISANLMVFLHLRKYYSLYSVGLIVFVLSLS